MSHVTPYTRQPLTPARQIPPEVGKAAIVSVFFGSMIAGLIIGALAISGRMSPKAVGAAFLGMGCVNALTAGIIGKEVEHKLIVVIAAIIAALVVGIGGGALAGKVPVKVPAAFAMTGGIIGITLLGSLCYSMSNDKQASATAERQRTQLAAF